MAKVYVDSCPSISTVNKWAADFKRGRERFEDDHHSRRPPAITTKENIEAVLDVIMDDHRVTINQITE